MRMGYRCRWLGASGLVARRCRLCRMAYVRSNVMPAKSAMAPVATTELRPAAPALAVPGILL